MIKIIPFAIPLFFLLIGLELAVAHLQGRRDYLRFNDAITAISCGIGSQVAKVFTGVVGVVAYTGLYLLAEPWWATFGGFGPASPWSWILAMFLVDHQYYWWHRHSHRVNFLWAAHVVHHQSSEYNLAVALRQALFTNLTSLPYYLPLALLGVHPLVFVLSAVANTLYQFWIHTRTIGRLGPLEWVLNTPSHHRVHHGINPQYIDKNYAGILIVWDRLFRTFEPEGQQPVYGTVKVLQSFDPLWANVAYWADMLAMARRATRARDRLWVWFAPPEWSPEGTQSIPQVRVETYEKWDIPLAPGLGAYVLAQFVVCGLSGTVWLLWFEDDGALPWLALLGGAVLWATWSWGQLFHRRSIGVISELVRLAVLPVVVALLLVGQPWQASITSVFGVICFASAAIVFRYRRAWLSRALPVDTREDLREDPAALAAAPVGRT